MKLAKATAENDIGRLLHQGAALQNAGDLQGAERNYLAVLKKIPRSPDALHLLGVLYGRRGDPKAGYAQIQKALAVRDDFPDAHSNSAMLAAEVGDLATAERHLRRAIQLAPHDVHRHLELVRTMRIIGDLPGQRAAAEAGLKVASGHSVLEIALAEAQFGLSDLKSAWHGYQRRFQSLENPIMPRNYPLPLWRGEPLAGRSILIWSEQGIGDEVMYANIFADVIARAQRCIIQCSPRVAALFRRSFPTAAIFDRDLSPDELRGIDFQSPAASLGEWLRADFASFPKHTGYLAANASGGHGGNGFLRVIELFGASP